MHTGCSGTRLRGFRAGDGKSMGSQGGIGLDRQKHEPDFQRVRVFLFLGEIILDMELEYDMPIKNLCGTCTRCIDACPTKALKPYTLDSRKCIACLTIEHRSDIPAAFKNQWTGWIFGCDISEEVCPWNKKAKLHSEKDFQPLSEISLFTKSNWENLTSEVFEKIFRKSPLKRTGFEGLKEIWSS